MMKSRIFNLLKIGISVGVLVFLLTRVGLGATAEILREAELRFVLAALVLYLLSFPLRAYRWQELLSAHRAAVRFPRLVGLYFTGAFFNIILPTSVGGDVMRAHGVAKEGAGVTVGASSVLADRAAGLLVLLALALVTTVFAYRLVGPELSLFIADVTVGTFTGVGIILWGGFKERVRLRLPALQRLLPIERIDEFYVSMHSYRGVPITKALFISLVFNLLLVAVNYLIALSMGVRVSVLYFLLFVPLISFSQLLPISLGGLGVREGAYVLLFSQAGVAAPLALAMSLTFYAFDIAMGLIGGVIYTLQGVGDLVLETK
jgi:uncharacterized protein (TIRG00374 family)